MMDPNKMKEYILKERAEEQFFEAKVAIGRRDMQTLISILNGRLFDINMQTRNSNGTLFHTAASLGDKDIITLLLVSGARIDVPRVNDNIEPLSFNLAKGGYKKFSEVVTDDMKRPIDA